MKQQITQEQWDKINDEQKKTFWGEEYHHNDPKIYKVDLPDIGQMIEFLGDDLRMIVFPSFTKKTFQVISYYRDFWGEELADALFEIVKYKLYEHLLVA